MATNELAAWSTMLSIDLARLYSMLLISKLRGLHIMVLWDHIVQIYAAENIRYGTMTFKKASKVICDYNDSEYPYYNRRYCEEACKKLKGTLYATKVLNDHMMRSNLGRFPAPSNININMMPIDLRNLASTLPKMCSGYLGLIFSCLQTLSSEDLGGISYGVIRSWFHWREEGEEGAEEEGEEELLLQLQNYEKKHSDRPPLVAYLTIHESMVGKGQTQRRPGLHTEAPGVFRRDYDCNWKPWRAKQLLWGNGEYVDHCVGTSSGGSFSGGIFMASTVKNSCRYWNASISRNAIGRLGTVEKFRSALTQKLPGRYMEHGRLYWVTDRTPHESMPVANTGNRQYFRLVVGEVSVWYTAHSTKNPCGLELPSSVRVIGGSKFK